MACKYCGYEINVHSCLSFRCPANDPYLPSKDRKWLNTEYETDEECEEELPNTEATNERTI